MCMSCVSNVDAFAANRVAGAVAVINAWERWSDRRQGITPLERNRAVEGLSGSRRGAMLRTLPRGRRSIDRVCAGGTVRTSRVGRHQRTRDAMPRASARGGGTGAWRTRAVRAVVALTVGSSLLTVAPLRASAAPTATVDRAVPIQDSPLDSLAVAQSAPEHELDTGIAAEDWEAPAPSEDNVVVWARPAIPSRQVYHRCPFRRLTPPTRDAP